jgi:hypothetical protein
MGDNTDAAGKACHISCILTSKAALWSNGAAEPRTSRLSRDSVELGIVLGISVRALVLIGGSLFGLSVP